MKILKQLRAKTIFRLRIAITVNMGELDCYDIDRAREQSHVRQSQLIAINNKFVFVRLSSPRELVTLRIVWAYLH